MKIGCVLFIALLGIPLYSAASTVAEVNIGINLPVYPELVVVPGYPVYYAPQAQANFFFYDGMYWVYQNDDWYRSSWYNGPWWRMDPEDVPDFVLRIPVRYYLQPPVYFRGWQSDAPPRWGEHWGGGWEQHRSGWDRWKRNAIPKPAPLPVYQQQYSGDRYPRQVEQQQKLQIQNYRYQPRDPMVRQHYQKQAVPTVPAKQIKQQPEKQATPEDRSSRQQDIQHPTPHQQGGLTAPRAQSPQQSSGKSVQRSMPASAQQERTKVQDLGQPAKQGAAQHIQQKPKSQDLQKSPQGRDAARKPTPTPKPKPKPKPKPAQGQEQKQERL